MTHPSSSSDASRRLWGVGTPRTLRAHWMLCELGLDYETRALLPRSAEMDSPEFARISPRRKIPILEDGDLVVGESAAIPLYLAERYRDRGDFLPRAGTDARAIHDDLCLFVMTEMDAILYVIRRHEGLPDIYGPSDVACDAAKAYFIRSSHECERRLSDGRTFLTGEDFKVADLLLKTCLDWASALAIPLAGTLQEFSHRTAERAAYRKSMNRNFPPSVQPTPAGVTT